MKRVALALLCAVSIGMVAASQADTQAVRDGFARYKQALLKKNGAGAASTVSANSLAYYDTMRALALSGTKPNIQAHDLAEQVLVLSMRVRTPMALLQSGSPAELIAYAVDEGMISPGTVGRTELGAISVQAEVADAAIVIEGKPVSGGSFKFYREGDSWKFDLEHASKLARGVFAAIAAQRGVTEEALLLDLLSRTSGRAVGQEVWVVPKPR